VETSEVRNLIETSIPGCRVWVDGEGCSFSVIVVSDGFEGLSPVKRQQQVLAAVKEPLATGALHAMTVKAYTSAEWERQGAAATGLVLPQ
jgi:acid stress-induced BolA-like protein IbaG/YrbA